MANDINEIFTELPVGYRFVPTDQELIKCYLMNKIFLKHVPGYAVKDIDENHFYSKPPNTIVEDVLDNREWYFFIRRDGKNYFRIVEQDKEHNPRLQNQMKLGSLDEQDYNQMDEKLRIVGNGLGFWRSSGKDESIYDTNGKFLGFKKLFDYLSKKKKTHWKMQEFHAMTSGEDQFKTIREEWVLVKITRGKCYRSSF